MDAKATVHARRPQAEARHHEPILADGGRAGQEGYWVITPGKGAGTSFLGRGSTEAGAWRRAAAVIEAQGD
jgi:hypothetical protein